MDRRQHEGRLERDLPEAVAIPWRLRAGRAAGHVEEAVSIGRKGANRRRPLEAVLEQVLPGNFYLPDLGHGVYQIGEVKARSCVVIGTFGSIFTLK